MVKRNRPKISITMPEEDLEWIDSLCGPGLPFHGRSEAMEFCVQEVRKSGKVAKTAMRNAISLQKQTERDLKAL